MNKTRQRRPFPVSYCNPLHINHPGKTIISLMNMAIIKALDRSLQSLNNISRDAITMISLHIYNIITNLIIEAKELSGLQGKTLVNILHLIFIGFHSRKKKLHKIDIADFIEHLIEKGQAKYNIERLGRQNGIIDPLNIQKFIRNKIISNESLKRIQVQSIHSFNKIMNAVPVQYEFAVTQYPVLFMKGSISQCLKKPNPHTYRQKAIIIKNPISHQQLMKKELKGQREMQLAVMSVKKVKREGKQANKTNKNENIKKKQQVLAKNILTFNLRQFI